MADHLPDDALLALAEGEGDDPHLAVCPDCRARVTACREALGAVARASVPARAWCPPREDLWAFAPDPGPAPTVALRAHVAACPACRDDVRDLLALHEVAPAPVPVRARVALALERLGDAAARALRLLESSLPLGPAPAPALARAEASGAGVSVVAPLGPGELELAWVAGARGVDLRARARGGAPNYRLDLSAPAGEAWALCESRSADEAGQVTLEGLPPGRYLLAVFGPQRGGPDLQLELDLQA
ncbi:MAG: hypothetical protein M9894_28260 [Planctomycetes bacterium]|nr:hypothetical protein [Planctomycetota bacterium]